MARKSATPRLAARDSLSNLAASLGTGRDKAAHDAFFVADLARDQIEAMYRGDWLARKVIDIVPYDSVREWREWAGPRDAITAIETAERRLGLRRALQRAMILGRLYGGGAIVIGTDEADAAALAAPLHPETMRPGSLRFLHVVSRWQLAVTAINHDPLDPYYGEPDRYMLASPERGELALHPSRVIRFLGNPLPDPLLYGAQVWSDSLLQTLYDAIHGVALTTTGATSLVHEAKVDIVTVPNLSEHLSNAATTAQLSARFAYAAAMKSINNLLLLGDGESWARQRVDFAGLPEMVRTFLQIAAGAADIPVTRLLGQSPAGLSATGDSDTRNYYDMISARQELDLRPQLERIDALLLRSAGVDPASVRFEFRPLWQLDAAAKAAVALQKAQTTQVYAGLNLWPAEAMADLVRSQLLEDDTYPGAEGVLSGEGEEAAGAGEALPAGTGPSNPARPVADFDPSQPRDPDGRWTRGGGGGSGPGRSTLDPAPSSQPSSGPTATGQPAAQPAQGDDQQGADLNQAVKMALIPILPLIASRRLLSSVVQQAVNFLKKFSAPFKAENKPSDPRSPPDLTNQPTEPPQAGGPAPPVKEQTPNLVTRGFAGRKSSQTWQNRMTKRGWTAQQIEDAIRRGEAHPAENRVNPGNGATRYVHPETGRSVIIDDTTGQVIQVGDEFNHD